VRLVRIAPHFRAPGVCALPASALLAGVVLSSGCAAHRFVPPAGPGEPAPEFAQQFEEATKACREVRTLTADASLSGRVAGQRVRGHLQLGLADPNALRLEAVAPFGAPVFILAARDGNGTLLLPRDRAVLRDTPADAIIEAIAGIKLTPDELRAVATGCVSPAPTATGGRRYPGDVTAITLKDQATAFVRAVNGASRIISAQRPGLIVEYEDFANGLPRKIRLSRDDSPQADLSLTLSQVELNTSLAPSAFTVDVPADARPITLDELRKNGPLGRDRPSP
jgi:outer membrane lipoprotein-sorting protein